MQQFIYRLVRYLVACAKAIELDCEDILAAGGPRSPAGFTHENFAHGAHVLLALYVSEHEANPLYRDPATLGRALRLIESWVGPWEASLGTEHPREFAEWPPFIVCRGLELLGDELDAATRDRWRRFIEHAASIELPQPFFFTSPNHEAWKLAMVATAGRLLEKPEWVKQAEFEGRQLVAYQAPQGFWEEGRHHGPSMKYNSLMLSGMAILARETGSLEIRDAAAGLAAFMTSWCFPDGVTAGVFDGRQSTSPGYYGRVCPGLELTPDGLSHLNRILEFQEKIGRLDDPRAVGPSNWYAYFGFPFPAESLLYYTSDAAEELADAEDALPIDEDGLTLESHDPFLDGTLVRRGRWAVGLSSQLSDVPKDTQFIYRLERQSRIEIWHETASVVLGGGHNLCTAAHPLYNVWVDTGWGDLPAPGSIPLNVDTPAGTPEMAARRSRYYVRAARSGPTEAGGRLEVHFAHAFVRFEITADGDDLEIRYTYECVPIAELRLAMPLLLWLGATGSIDGKPVDVPGGEAAVLPVEREVQIVTPAFGSTTTLLLPADGRHEVTFGLEPVRTYGKLFDDERFESFFTMARVDTILTNPPTEGTGAWKIKVQ